MLVLASASPRRRDLLTRAGVEFRVEPADIDESSLPGEAPEALAERLAREKAAHVARRFAGEAAVVLGADTIVVLGPDVLGKPRDSAHARELLGRLVGREHRVITGVAVGRAGDWDADTEWHSCTVSSRVWMHPVTGAEIAAYVATGEPLDKAGAYAFQGEGRRFVRAVEGSETNVIGLPLEESLALLGRFGVGPAGRS
jgi:septum formation protein